MVELEALSDLALEIGFPVNRLYEPRYIPSTFRFRGRGPQLLRLEAGEFGTVEIRSIFPRELEF